MSEQFQPLGLSEVAELFGVSRQTVTNWRTRHYDFPKPMVELKSGPIWKRQDITNWAAKNGIAMRNYIAVEESPQEEEEKMPISVALVNMKGGVGKSTLTANLGWYCAYRKDMKVLLVDLDPQFNLSQYILGQQRYANHLEAGKGTVLRVFEQYTPSAISGVPKTELTPDDVLVHVAHWGDSSGIDLLPSELELAWTLKNPHAKERLLTDFLGGIRSEYDIILIDCPPTESMLTTAAYFASDYVLVPVRPEYLSTIGLPLLERSLNEFRGLYKQTIKLLGIVFNASGDKPENTRARADVEKEAKAQGWYVFEHEVSHSDSYPKGARIGRPIFLTDNARWWKIDELRSVANEFITRIGL